MPILSRPVCILDTNLKVKYANQSFLAFFSGTGSDVTNQPFDQAFSWTGTLRNIPSLLPGILDGSQPGASFEFSGSLISGSPEKFLLIVSGIRSELPFHTSPVTGILLSVIEKTAFHHLQDHKQSCHSLINVIHEVTAFDQDAHPAQFIQMVVSRLGPIIQVPFISFLKFNDEQGEKDLLIETVLWSFRYGFMLGEEWSDLPSHEKDEVHQIRTDIREKGQILYTRDMAPAVLRRTILQREVTDILIIPALYEKKVYGCFILWGSHLISEPNVSALQTIGLIVGAKMTKARVQADLEQSQEKFRGVIEYIGDLYYRTDKTGALLEMSPSMATVLGYSSPDLLIGMSFETLLMYPDIWPLFLSEVLHEDGVKDYELILKGAQGKIITGSVSCRLVYTEAGELQGIEGVIRDISRRRQYEQLIHESEWKLEQAQKIAKLGVWSYDTEARSFKVSPEVFSILAIPADQNLITLDDIIQIASEPDRPFISRYFDYNPDSREEFGCEFKIDLPHEKYKYIRVRGQPKIRGGMVTGSFGILQDITERKEVEKHLLRYANQLEQKTLELDAMRTQLLDMNRELDRRVRSRTTQIEELLRQKDEFIMQIGHDLKTPLTPLVAILPYIRKKISDPEILELLDVSIEDVKAIRKMITTILELAQMNALYSLSDLQQINLHEILDQIISDNAYLIHQKSLTVKNEIPESYTVMMSPMHLETLMGNLIGNSVKYSYIDGTIMISASEQIGSIRIKIQDFGIGIEPEVLPRIFDEFFKADSSRHDRDSHGLGLAIAQRIIDIYGGSIRAESEGVGKGTTFSVNLKKNPPVRKNSE